MSEIAKKTVVQGVAAFAVASLLVGIMLFYRNDPGILAFVESVGMGIFTAAGIGMFFDMNDKTISHTTSILIVVALVLLLIGAGIGLYLEWPYL